MTHLCVPKKNYCRETVVLKHDEQIHFFSSVLGFTPMKICFVENGHLTQSTIAVRFHGITTIKNHELFNKFVGLIGYITEKMNVIYDFLQGIL